MQDDYGDLLPHQQVLVMPGSAYGQARARYRQAGLKTLHRGGDA